jgi:hypothetical protein
MPYTFEMCDLTEPNPTLWIEFTTFGTTQPNYAIAPIAPSLVGKAGEWVALNQFCSVLAAEWLTGTRAAAWGVSNLGAAGVQAAVATLLGFQTQGAGAQIDYAMATLGGARTTVEEITDATPVGTKIWAASNNHVVGAYLDGKDSFTLYDPNNGKVQSYSRTEFLKTMRAYHVNLIVVR